MGTGDRDGLGLGVDMIDVDRLRHYGRALRVMGLAEPLSAFLDGLADRLDGVVRDVGTLRRMTAPATGEPLALPAAWVPFAVEPVDAGDLVAMADGLLEARPADPFVYPCDICGSPATVFGRDILIGADEYGNERRRPIGAMRAGCDEHTPAAETVYTGRVVR